MKIPMYFDSMSTVSPKYSKKINGYSKKTIKQFRKRASFLETHIPEFLDPFSTMVSGNEAYYYPISLNVEVINAVNYNKMHGLTPLALTIPEKVLKDLYNEQAKLLFINVEEGFSLSDFESVIFNLLKNYRNINSTSIVLLTGNMINKSPTGIVNIYYNSWEFLGTEYQKYMPDLQHRAIVNILRDNESRRFKFICLQRRLKKQRLALYAELMHRKDGILTQGTGNFRDRTKWRQIVYDTKHAFHRTFENVDMNDIISTLPKEYDCDVSVNNPTYDADVTKYLDAYLHVVSETYFNESADRKFFSEKIYKPVVFFQPFVLFATSGMIEEFRKLGFRTFSPYIDENYDNIKDDKTRFYSALNSLQKFIDRDEREIKQDMYKMLPIFQHNYDCLIERRTFNFNLKLAEKLHQNLRY